MTKTIWMNIKVFFARRIRFTTCLVTILIADMVFYFTHYMMHKTEIGWAIHKVHHSAQVLTPLTRPREHFIAGPIWALGPAIGITFAASIFAWAFGGDNLIPSPNNSPKFGEKTLFKSTPKS